MGIVELLVITYLWIFVSIVVYENKKRKENKRWWE